MIQLALLMVLAVVSGFSAAFGLAVAWDWLDRRYGWPRLG